MFKRYVVEAESEALLGRIEDAPAVGTALITRVEVAAALAKAVRDGRMPSAEAREAENDFLDDWADFTRIGLTDDVAARAGGLAWKHDLRGYDAAQLAAALAWREATEDARGPGRVRLLRQRSAPGGCGGRPRDMAGMNAPAIIGRERSRRRRKASRQWPA